MNGTTGTRKPAATPAANVIVRRIQGRQIAATTRTGMIAHPSMAPAKPNASPPHASLRRLAVSLSLSNTATAPSRQNSTSHGSTRTVWAAAMLSGNTARTPHAISAARAPRCRTSRPARTTPPALASTVRTRPIAMPDAVPVSLATSAAGLISRMIPGGWTKMKSR